MSRIESILLASADPERLRRWYAAAFQARTRRRRIPAAGRGCAGRRARRRTRPHRRAGSGDPQPPRAVHQGGRGPPRRARGARWVSPVEYRDAGLWFGTVEDPDGNYVQLIETTPAYWEKKAERAGAAVGPLVHASAAIRLPAEDLERARGWYAEKLGLEPVEERPGGLRYVCGDTEFVVFASTGKASGDHTQMGFHVPDLDLAVEQLRQRGVEFDGDIVEVTGHYPSTGASASERSGSRTARAT